tara:strand:+ start:629 stop:967 length:339 start_codon:yes stop_codon:yes gene_type:complete
MHSIKATTISLRISSVLYLLIGIFVLPIFLFFDHFFIDDIIFSFWTYFLLILTLGIIVFIEVVIASLKKRKKWSWFAALIICAIYIPSAFIILGIIGIIPLLKEEVKSDFGI